MVPAEVHQHLLDYWARCRGAFEAGDFPIAAFLAITLLEEVGKIPMLALRPPGSDIDRGFRNHRKKYASAVGQSLVVNSRVTRIYGERENVFARWYRDGELMRIRNSALYVDVDEDRILTPREVVTRDTAFLLVCFGGECLAEMQGDMTGTGPAEWQRILDEVDEFRVRQDGPVQSAHQTEAP